MVITDKIISNIDSSLIQGESITILNSIIDSVDLSFNNFESSITIRSCIIKNLFLHSAWFKQGFILENNIVYDKVIYEMGGHNDKAICIKNNVFHDFFSFFDCQFNELLIVENNIFQQGTNLFCDMHVKGSTFAEVMTINNNVGELNSDRID